MKNHNILPYMIPEYKWKTTPLSIWLIEVCIKVRKLFIVALPSQPWWLKHLNLPFDEEINKPKARFGMNNFWQ